MKTLSTTIFGAVILIASPAAITTASAAQSTVTIDDPHISAKLAREKTRQRTLRSRFGNKKQSGNQSEDCGTVSIGDNKDDRRPGGLRPRNQTIIVTGPIINTANCR